MVIEAASAWRSIVVVGGSLAGDNAVEALRDRGFEGRIVLVSGEDQLPYDRPPLSKAMLAGKAAADDLVLRPGARFDELDIDLRLGVRATRLDLESRTVELGDATL